MLPLNFSPQATLEAMFQKPSLTRGRTTFEYHQGTIRIPGRHCARREESLLHDHCQDRGSPCGGRRRDRHAGRPIRRLGVGHSRWQTGLGLQANPAETDGHADRRPGQAHAWPAYALAGFHLLGQAGELARAGPTLSASTATKSPRAAIDATVPFRFSVDETLDIGQDCGTPILEDYADRMPFKFTGKIEKVTIELK